MISLYDYMKMEDIDADCYDKVVDVGTCMGIVEGSMNICDFVNNYILHNTELVKIGDACDAHCLVGDFWKFAEEHYDKFVRFTSECNNDRYQMDSEDREENLVTAVDSIICLEQGNYGQKGYTRFAEIFNILPEDHVVYDWTIMDIDDYLARKEREANDFEGDQDGN